MWTGFATWGMVYYPYEKENHVNAFQPGNKKEDARRVPLAKKDAPEKPFKAATRSIRHLTKPKPKEERRGRERSKLRAEKYPSLNANPWWDPQFPRKLLAISAPLRRESVILRPVRTRLQRSEPGSCGGGLESKPRPRHAHFGVSSWHPFFPGDVYVLFFVEFAVVHEAPPARVVESLDLFRLARG